MLWKPLGGSAESRVRQLLQDLQSEIPERLHSGDIHLQSTLEVINQLPPCSDLRHKQITGAIPGSIQKRHSEATSHPLIRAVSSAYCGAIADCIIGKRNTNFREDVSRVLSMPFVCDLAQHARLAPQAPHLHPCP